MVWFLPLVQHSLKAIPELDIPATQEVSNLGLIDSLDSNSEVYSECKTFGKSSSEKIITKETVF